jgi:hypothetical protein
MRCGKDCPCTDCGITRKLGEAVEFTDAERGLLEYLEKTSLAEARDEDGRFKSGPPKKPKLKPRKPLRKGKRAAGDRQTRIDDLRKRNTGR